jgi:hypothetical protein
MSEEFAIKKENLPASCSPEYIGLHATITISLKLIHVPYRNQHVRGSSLFAENNLNSQQCRITLLVDPSVVGSIPHLLDACLK